MRLAALWSGVLAGPLVFLLLLETNYVLAYVACETRRTWFLYATAALSVALVAGAGASAWRAAIDDPLTKDEATSPLGEQTALQRVRWMVGAAVVLTVGFALLIVSLAVPVIVLEVCD